MQKAKNRDNTLSYELREQDCNVHITPLEKQSCVSVVQKYTAQIGFKMGPKNPNLLCQPYEVKLNIIWAVLFSTLFLSCAVFATLLETKSDMRIYSFSSGFGRFCNFL